MRVVAGELRGRRIVAPEGRTTRPTTDRVREAVFNALGSMDEVVDRRVIDLYAGSGALGIEALSRGAAHCTFVERDSAALRALRDNLATLGLEQRANVVTGDVMSVAGALRADLALADPPYDFTTWERLLGSLSVGLVVAEGHGPVDAPPGWSQERTRRYGRTWVTFLRRDGANE